MRKQAAEGAGMYVDALPHIEGAGKDKGSAKGKSRGNGKGLGKDNGNKGKWGFKRRILGILFGACFRGLLCFLRQAMSSKA